MSGSRLFIGACIQSAVSALLLLPLACTAEAPSASASRQLAFRVVVPPVLRVLQVTPLQDGYEYRIWTNTKSAFFNGREHRFATVGEHTLRLPSPPQGMVLVHGL